jgi:hypothetical protein
MLGRRRDDITVDVRLSDTSAGPPGPGVHFRLLPPPFGSISWRPARPDVIRVSAGLQSATMIATEQPSCTQRDSQQRSRAAKRLQFFWW